MDALEAIRTRRSIRKFEDKPIPEELLTQVLEAAMYAPSACNAQPWQFVVITDRETLRQVTIINPYAAMAAQSPLSVLVCGDTSLEISPGFWVVDCAAAVQNLLLAVHAVGLGAVWTGVWPRQARIDDLQQLLGLPAHVVPHSLLVLGYPAEQPAHENRFHAERVHRERW